jgi:energy-coupling factor transporter ATP-binding protein EcfA2
MCFQNPEHQFARGSVLDEVMLGPLRTGADEDEREERSPWSCWSALDCANMPQ